MSKKSWLYTLNNWTDVEFCSVKNWECNYHVVGCEVGEKGTPHLQGCITFSKPCRIKSLKKLNERIHWEAVNNIDMARNYCTKGKDVFIRDNRKQGERSDLILLANKLSSGITVTEVAKEFPSDFIRYHRGIERFAELVQYRFESANYTLEECCKYVELSPLENYTNVIIGKPNCGKTQFALAHFIRPLFVSHMDDLLEFKPEVHTGIVFDDMDFRHMPRTAQIHLTDYENSRSIHCRYRCCKIPRHTCKIFTCNVYPFDEDEAIGRRVTVTEVTKR